MPHPNQEIYIELLPSQEGPDRFVKVHPSTVLSIPHGLNIPIEKASTFALFLLDTLLLSPNGRDAIAQNQNWRSVLDQLRLHLEANDEATPKPA